MLKKIVLENIYSSEHFRVFLHIKFNKIQNVLLKFRNSLLADKEYVKITKETINKIFKYAILT